MPLIGIMSDFGYQDAYAGIMQGVILKRLPDCRIIDLGQQVPSFSIRSASYLLYTSWGYLPPGSTVLCVVDPGVGSGRRELIAGWEGRYLVAPDNGCISLIERFARIKGSPLSVRRADEDLLEALEEKRPPEATTFDGRDLFAPLAAELADLGFEAVTGKEITPILLDDLETRYSQGESTKQVSGIVQHIDHFGNAVTSIEGRDLSRAGRGKTSKNLQISLNGQKIPLPERLLSSFAEAGKGEPLAYIGSSGFLEIAVGENHAANQLGIRIGDEVVVCL
ncbi:MAG: SAM-dependent chlorinase/fluorinase [Spirochaetales bacterium]|nr:SAM-dependent chlorinase/fluorinase [Spirochaetales bacterium]MCF7939540.1 SAM-dependent chlorinase/fluorinase [Spirochaetales bacterium]